MQIKFNLSDKIKFKKKKKGRKIIYIGTSPK